MVVLSNPSFKGASTLRMLGLLLLFLPLPTYAQTSKLECDIEAHKLSSSSYVERNTCRRRMSLSTRVRRVRFQRLSYRQLLSHAKEFLYQARKGSGRSRELASHGLGLILRRNPWFLYSSWFRTSRRDLKAWLGRRKGRTSQGQTGRAVVGSLLHLRNASYWGFSSSLRRRWNQRLKRQFLKQGFRFGRGFLLHRVLACSTRGWNGRKSRRRLLQWLRSSVPSVRASAWNLLAENKGLALRLLRRLQSRLNEDNKHVQASLSQAFANMGKKAIPTLLKAMRDRRLMVRRNAANALRTLGSAAVSALERQLSSRSSSKRLQAAYVLEGMSRFYKASSKQRSLARLIRRERNTNVLVSLLSMTQKLRRHQKPLENVLVRLSRKRNRWIRSVLVETYFAHRSTYRRTLLRLLLRDLRQRDRRIKLQSIENLRRYGAKRSLRKVTKRGHIRVRAAAIWALGKLFAKRQPSSSWLDELDELLKHRSWRIRYAAAEALNEMGRNSKPLTASLVAGLDDRNWGVRAASLQAIRKIGVASLRQLRTALRSRSSRARLVATDAVGQMKGGERQRARVLRRMLSRDRSRLVRYQAMLGLSRLKRVRLAGQRTLLRATRRKDWGTREKAARMLVVFAKRSRVHKRLIRLTRGGGHPAVNEAAIHSISRFDLGGKRALQTSLSHRNWRFRWASLQALGRMGRKAKSLLPLVRKRLQDRVQPVRWAAALSLLKIAGSIRQSDVDVTPRSNRGVLLLVGSLFSESVRFQQQCLAWMRRSSNRERNHLFSFVRVLLTNAGLESPLGRSTKSLSESQTGMLLPILHELLAMSNAMLRHDVFDVLKQIAKRFPSLADKAFQGIPSPTLHGAKAWTSCRLEEPSL